VASPSNWAWSSLYSARVSVQPCAQQGSLNQTGVLRPVFGPAPAGPVKSWPNVSGLAPLRARTESLSEARILAVATADWLATGAAGSIEKESAVMVTAADAGTVPAVTVPDATARTARMGRAATENPAKIQGHRNR
jgi:hypothetical protein